MLVGRKPGRKSAFATWFTDAMDLIPERYHNRLDRLPLFGRFKQYCGNWFSDYGHPSVFVRMNPDYREWKHGE